MRWLGIQLMRYHHIICDLLYIAWNLTKSRDVCCFFFWLDNLQRSTNTLPLRGKSERETSICPWKLFVTISCGPSLRRIPLRVKMPRKQTGHCFQNAPKIPFSWHTLYKSSESHFATASLTASFQGNDWSIRIKTWGGIFFKGRVVRRKSSCLFSNWAPASCGQEAGEGNCEKEDSLFTISDMFLDKDRLSKQVTFSTPEKWSWPS